MHSLCEFVIKFRGIVGWVRVRLVGVLLRSLTSGSSIIEGDVFSMASLTKGYATVDEEEDAVESESNDEN